MLMWRLRIYLKGACALECLPTSIKTCHGTCVRAWCKNCLKMWELINSTSPPTLYIHKFLIKRITWGLWCHVAQRLYIENVATVQTASDKVSDTLRSCCAVTHFRGRMGEGDAEGLSFVMASDVTLQTVLAAKRLLAAVTGTVEWLLPYKTSRHRSWD